MVIGAASIPLLNRQQDLSGCVYSVAPAAFCGQLRVCVVPMLRTVFSFGFLGVGLLAAASQVDFDRYIQIDEPEIIVPPSPGATLKSRAAVPEAEEAARHSSGTETDAEPSAERAIVLNKPWKPALTGTVSDAELPRLTGLKPADEEAHRDLTRDLQGELVRVGCYAGSVDGHWSVELEKSLKEFNVRLNSVLPTDHPDYAQLTLIRSQNDGVCNAPLPITITGARIEITAARIARKVQVSRLRGSRPRMSEVQELFRHPLGRQ